MADILVWLMSAQPSSRCEDPTAGLRHTRILPTPTRTQNLLKPAKKLRRIGGKRYGEFNAISG